MVAFFQAWCAGVPGTIFIISWKMARKTTGKPRRAKRPHTKRPDPQRRPPRALLPIFFAGFVKTFGFKSSGIWRHVAFSQFYLTARNESRASTKQRACFPRTFYYLFLKKSIERFFSFCKVENKVTFSAKHKFISQNAERFCAKITISVINLNRSRTCMPFWNIVKRKKKVEIHSIRHFWTKT